MVIESLPAWTDEGMMEGFDKGCIKNDLTISRVECRETTCSSAVQHSATFISSSDDMEDCMKKDEEEEENGIRENDMLYSDSSFDNMKPREVVSPREVIDDNQLEEEAEGEDDGTAAWILSWQNRYPDSSDRAALTAALIAETNALYGNDHEEREEPPPSPLSPLF
ncbi:hypothetical protein PRIPAC_74341 [Pristionchus pacificus]|uniref:Uncharacterized protein n=1 Tax=Pristionchus pacificus TaxID=54126 RepID=A0A2A6C126_PRIPA|nr:hypothetical protein PRIPAC_74341 [Pristionchus pacificus]|eukprot:PDM71731.1 hypothetical protein PRIPAC_38138 [Pristionchus pacificus]